MTFNPISRIGRPGFRLPDIRLQAIKLIEDSHRPDEGNHGKIEGSPPSNRFPFPGEFVSYPIRIRCSPSDSNRYVRSDALI